MGPLHPAPPRTPHITTFWGARCYQLGGQKPGVVWHVLQSEGPMSLAKLVRTVGAPRDLVQQAVGWLAREEKVCIEEGRRSRQVSLKNG